MTSMKQAIIRKTGGPEVIEIEEADRPTPKAGEILIAVKAAGVNFSDVLRRRDSYREKTPVPLVIGAEVAGFVEAVGPGVTKFKKGDRVLGFSGVGGYAEYAIANENFANPISDDTGFAESTAFLIQGLSAYLMLTDAAPSAGKSIVIEAAAGGVGSLMVQIARRIGVTNIIAIASTEGKRARAKELGAHHAIDALAADRIEQIQKITDGKGADIYFEMSGDRFLDAVSATRSFGTVVTYGNASNTDINFKPGTIIETNQTVRGFYVGDYFGPDNIHLAMGATQALIDMFREGSLKISIQRYALSDASLAHRDVEDRKTTGKVVLEP